MTLKRIENEFAKDTFKAPNFLTRTVNDLPSTQP